MDERLGKQFHFARAPRDLVYEDMLLPDDAPFATVGELANALDEAERRRQRRSTNRKRWAQFGAHLIFALPPEQVLTLDEAVELVERVVHRAVGGSSSLPVYIAIHDPALASPGAVTRHGHVLFGLREVVGAGLSRKKVRNLFAQPRHAAAPNVRSSYVAEGLSWPDMARDLQNELFAEIGSEALVDPPAPFAGRHWSVKTLRHSPERRTRHDQSVDRQNIELINGDPAELVAHMLRGRSLMRIDEVRRLLAHFLDSADNREQRLDAILTHTAIATFANDPAETQPRWLTTKAVADQMRTAVAVVDRAVAERRDRGPAQPPALDITTASSEAAIVSTLVNRLSDSLRPIHRPLILGKKHSDCRALAAAIGHSDPIVGTFAALKAAPLRNRHGRTGRIGLRRGGLIAVPHAESVDDQDLATLLLRAEQYGARLLLGYDVSRASPSFSLAARLADVLGDSDVVEAEDIVRELQVGLVNRASRALYQHGKVRFGSADQTAGEAADFVVCDDLTRLASADREIHEAQPDDADAGAMLAIETANGPLPLQRGQWIVYTANDYATEHIRVGRFARVVGASSPHGLEVAHPSDVEANLDLRTFPHVRSAHAISIREARQTPKDAKLLIEVTSRQHAWSTALLAASRADSAVVHIDPSVAKNLEEWIAAVASSKPTPLLTDLAARIDPVAELNVLMRMIYLDPTAKPKVEKRPLDGVRPDDWMQSMSDLAKGTSEQARDVSPYAANATAAVSATSILPVVTTLHQPDILSEEQRRRLHDDLRKALYWNSDTQLALGRLQSALGPTNHQRHIIAENLRRACPPDGPMATLVQVLLGQQERIESDEFDELELPEEMLARMPRGWGLWEMWQFRMDLQTMADPHANWPMPLGPVAPVRGSSPHKDAPGHFGR
jgi:hypothetical protein